MVEVKDNTLKDQILARNAKAKVECERKSKMISFSASPSLLQSLKKEAKKRGMDYQAFVVEILTEYVAQASNLENVTLNAKNELNLESRVRALESQFAKYVKAKPSKKRT